MHIAHRSMIENVSARNLEWSKNDAKFEQNWGLESGPSTSYDRICQHNAFSPGLDKAWIDGARIVGRQREVVGKLVFRDIPGVWHQKPIKNWSKPQPKPFQNPKIHRWELRGMKAIITREKVKGKGARKESWRQLRAAVHWFLLVSWFE